MNEVIAQLLERLSEIKNAIKKIEDIKRKQLKVDMLADKFYNEETKKFNPDVVKDLKKDYPDMAKKVENINKLMQIIATIPRGGIREISPQEFVAAMQAAGINIFRLNDYANDFNYCKEMDGIVHNPSLEEENIRKEYNNTILGLVKNITMDCITTLRTLANQLRSSVAKEYGKTYDIELINKELESLRNEASIIEKYLPLFKEEGFVYSFENDEELNEFYEWMKEYIPLEKQIDIILSITKGKLRKALDENIGEEEIDENRKILEEEVLSAPVDELENILRNLDNFNEEDKEIIKEFILKYKDLCSSFTDRAPLLDESATIEERKALYLMNDTYNWESVLSDIEDNILPDLEKKLLRRDQNTLDAIKYLSELYDREAKEIPIREEHIKKVRDYIDSLEGLMKYAEKYDASSYEYVIEEKMEETDEAYPKGVPFEQIEMCYFLNHHAKPLIDKLKDVYDHLKNSERMRESLDDEGKERHVNFELVDERYNKVYQAAQTRINKFKWLREAMGDYDDAIDEEGIEFNPSENLVFCLDINVDDLDDNAKKEMLETLKDHEEKKSWVMKKNPSSELKNHTKNAKNKTHITVLSTDDYDAYRHRGTPNGRTGIIKFKLDGKVKKLLEARYSLGPQCGVYGVFNAINVPGADHDTYQILTDYVKLNKGYISHISDLLRGRKNNMKELYSIIDQGIEVKDRIISSAISSDSQLGGMR